MDHIANMLITLKNGGAAKKEFVYVPYSNLKAAIATKLFEMGYIKSYAKKNRKNGTVLEMGIQYTVQGPRINDVKRISKLSRRLYVGVKDIRPVKQGKGALIISTPKGILNDTEARNERVGGEPLFEIW
ncbi:MAG: 30S ribosomal protein S8 [Candidatus Pacebacteria bacterium]|nr:30S ribosomal protein S8 [Candidatus Paceibacterota bacterium]MCD8508027.1 30S ribosomal protein S8 [Candidatus Paceibacterota bacterium]MCD8528335.1 30S ribosomal protein S8 [Candidatus Paceibacterota bacterium]MCD8563807.1 30S ribosomal protein S8 [Candidatus Paceibacterota bacterium]